MTNVKNKRSWFTATANLKVKRGWTVGMYSWKNIKTVELTFDSYEVSKSKRKATVFTPLLFYYTSILLIMRYAAFAASVCLKNLLEEQADFEEEVCNACFVASAGAVC